MQVRHNTSLLEKAVEEVIRRASIPSMMAESEVLQAEAEALQRRSEALKTQAEVQQKVHRAASLKRLATGVAIGIAAFGIGLGIYLATSARIERVDVAKASPTSPVQPAPPVSTGKTTDRIPPSEIPITTPKQQEPSTEKSDNAPSIDTTDFTIFRTVDFLLGQKRWIIQAGHRFATEADQTSLNWSDAWCYTTYDKDGTEIKINLGKRATNSVAPSFQPVSAKALADAKLTQFEAETLASKCPWLDKKTFAVEPKILQPNDLNGSFQLQGSVLHFSGPIEAGFLSRLVPFQFSSLVIDSPGGVVDEAIATGRMLRFRKISVTAERECLSACVFVLAGGVIRNAAPDTNIGVHRFFKNAEAEIGDIEIGQRKSAEILEYLRQMGIADDLWMTMSKTPSDTMKYLDVDVLRRWHLLSAEEIVVGDEPAADNGLDAIVPESPKGNSAGDSFIRVGGRDAPGNDFPGMPLRGFSELQCQVKCQSETACIAATYNEAHQACFLKSNATSLVAFSGAVTYYRRKANPRME